MAREMVRISPVAGNGEERSLLAAVDGDRGNNAPNLFRTLVRHPGLMRRTNALAGELLLRGQLPEQDREMAILRVAAVTSCEYERRHHETSAAAAGLSADEINWLTNFDVTIPTAHLRLRRIVDAVDQLLAHYDLSDEIWSELEQLYSTEQVIEFVVLVGFYALLASFANATRTPLDDE